MERTATEQITITLPLPPRELHPNSRVHWAVRSKKTKLRRELAFLTARQAMEHLACPPRWKKAGVHFEFHVNKRHDVDNLLAWTKATIDGIADAGVVDNDRDFCSYSVDQVVGCKRTDAHMVVTISKLDERRGS